MRTRSQTHNRPQQQVPPTFVEPFDLEEPINITIENKNQNQNHQDPPVVTMADQRTMAQLLQAPTEGYEDAIVVPIITADNFKLKHGLLTLVQNKQCFGHDKEDHHAHIRYFNKITSTLKFLNVPNTSIKLMLFPFSLEGATVDFVYFALRELEIHSLMIQIRILSMILKIFSTTLHNPSIRRILASFVETMLIMCQPMNQNFYNSNSSSFDQFQPPQYPVVHQPPKEVSIKELKTMMQSYCEIMSQRREQEAILLQDEEKQELLAEEHAANPSEPSPVSYFYNADYDNISTPSTTYTIHLTKSATIITNPSKLTRRIYHNHDIFYDGDDDEELLPDEIKRIQQILKRTSNDSPSLPINESFHFDVPSSPRPPAKPPDDDEIEPDTELLTAKGWRIAPDYEASRARGFVLCSLELQHPQLHYGNPISNLIDKPLSLSILNKRI
ncbi:hypothetical protein Tco_0492862 [Tanacetum coccineum]